MRYLTVCSGIEAPSVAWEPLGWEPLAFSEIDKFPRAVLQHHWPDVPLFGDFTTIQESEIDGSVELICGGTPCQAFSVAGNRKGLADDRGNLALEFCRLAARTGARWIVWENVPGVLSNNGGRDFGSFIGMLEQLGYGVCWRVLDAQYVRVQSHPFAVPQRRRRVFVVASLGDWRPSASVLFERSCSLRNSPPRREAGKAAAPTIAARPTDGGGLGTDFDLDGGLVTNVPGGAARCLNAGGTGRIDMESETFVFDRSQVTHPENRSTMRGDTTHSLTSQGGPPTLCQDVADPIVVNEQATYTHEGENNFRMRNTIAFQDSQSDMRMDDVHGTLDSNYGPRRRSGVIQGPSVRRLTPLECERLMGMPEGHTLVPYRGKPAKDSPRYKALGNSICVNVLSWLGQRIMEVDKRCKANQ